MTQSEFPDGKAILDSIKEDSRKRRNSPVEFFKEFLRDIWMDNTSQDAVRQWTTKVKHGPWYANDALYCMDIVSSTPPDNLVDILQQYGWISLTHESDERGKEAEYSYQEYLDWLKSIRNEFQIIYDSAKLEEDEESK